MKNAAFSPAHSVPAALGRTALLLALVAAAATGARAQSPYVGEALNYSRLQFGGPARTQGIAGANVALGADFGNLSSNPAGLGLFQKSEAHFAPGLGLGAADARGTSGSLTANQNSLHVGSAGLVFTNRRPDGDDSRGGWRGGSFGLGFTRLADFNTTFRYANTTTDANSFFQFLNEPDGNTNYLSPGYQSAIADLRAQDDARQYKTIGGLAYGNFLTDIIKVRRPDGGQSEQVRAVRRNGPIAQTETVTTSGSLSQFDLAYGGSYRDQLYVGGGLGIVALRRERTSTLGEDSEGAFDFRLEDQATTSGTGLNARLGLIYRANDAVRVGASIQSPTYIRLLDTYGSTLTVNRDFLPANSTLSNVLSTVPGTYSYNIVTPFRANAGVAVLFKKAGFLTGDVEYVGYQQARLSGNPKDTNGDSYAFGTENDAIRQAYKGTVNVRLGAEARLDAFRVRAGYARYGDPYAGGIASRQQQFFTAGLGLRQRSLFFDVAGVYAMYDQQYSPYTLASGNQPVIRVSNTRLTTTVTAGVTF